MGTNEDCGEGRCADFCMDMCLKEPITQWALEVAVQQPEH